ncbi:ABC transporter substrate-binding protein [Glaciihabitans arcticus]|uniref:ABC transporter substrate-binding protein n=1 Tax=Glaciihabitans arcticus TaxID=2668039 RepID=A0A4Q9GQD5_9MICO|nr:ABC transporter substrate-binding protein [Glaciihabitans arcticus]TBN55465.1 ABC transporter substrate-binding protein [Glaciihabitans arcticus]
MKKLIGAAAVGAMLIALTGCATGGPDAGSGGGGTDDLIVGFSQVGAESGWRTANTISIQGSFKAADIELKFSDAQGKQENQIKAIRSYIQQGVDVIAFSPVVESGWDTVLGEAKAAGIPVVLTDRSVDSTDDTLYESFLGSDFILEGEKAGDWVNTEFADATDVKVVELQGTTGAAPANDRAEGFRNKVTDPKFDIVATQTGDFTRAGGKQVMEAFLKANPKIDLVYAHNDDMGLGAIEAIEAAGLVPGKDIKIVTVDAVKDGMTALAAGKINFIVECSPLLGDQLVDIAKKVAAGETVEKRIVTEETTFDQEQAKAALPDRKY